MSDALEDFGRALPKGAFWVTGEAFRKLAEILVRDRARLAPACGHEYPTPKGRFFFVNGTDGAAADEYGLQVYRSVFDGEGDPPMDQGLRVKVRHGWINALVPTNITDEFTVSDDATTTIYYQCTTDAGAAGALVSVEIMTGDLTSDPAGTDDHAPSTTSRALATVIASGGQITSILNDGRGSRSVVAVVTAVSCGKYTLAYLHSPQSVAPDASSIGYADHESRISALEALE